MSWTCLECERELPWKDFRHYCKRVSLDTLFEARSEELVLVFDKILAEVPEKIRSKCCRLDELGANTERGALKIFRQKN